MATMDVRDALAFAKQMKAHFALFEHATEVLELVVDGEQVAKETADRARVAHDEAQAELKRVHDEAVAVAQELITLRNEITDAREQRAVAQREHVEVKTALLSEVEGLTKTRDDLQKAVAAIRASAAQVAGSVGV